MNMSYLLRNGSGDTTVISKIAKNGSGMDVFAVYPSGKIGGLRILQSFQLPCVTLRTAKTERRLFQPIQDRCSPGTSWVAVKIAVTIAVCVNLFRGALDVIGRRLSCRGC